jgi:solute carrier family 41
MKIDSNSRLARLLWSLVIPTQIFFLIIIYFWQKNFVFTAPFLLSYCLAVQIQLSFVLYLGFCGVMWSWRKKLNPDNSAIPFNSVMADFFGNFLMAGTFTFLNAIGDVNAIKHGDTVVSNITKTLNNTLTTTINSTFHY